jgi:hypothetical protein
MSRFKVLTTGYYMVSSMIYTARATGRYEVVKNPDRRWFQFWKPKTIEKEVYETVGRSGGQEIRFLNRGEFFEGEFMERIWN